MASNDVTVGWVGGVLTYWAATRIWWRMRPARKAASPLEKHNAALRRLASLEQREREWTSWASYVCGNARATGLYLPPRPDAADGDGSDPTSIRKLEGAQ